MRVVIEGILFKVSDVEGISFEASLAEVDLDHRSLGVLIVVRRHIVVHMRHIFPQVIRVDSLDVFERVVVNLTPATVDIES